MRATFDAKVLAEAVAAVANAVAARTTKPVLAHVKLDVRNGGATVTATDTEVAVRRFVDVTADDDGCVLLDPKKVCDWLKEQRGDVSVGVKGEEVVLAVGAKKLRLPYLSPDEFPDVQAGEGEAGVKFVVPYRTLATLFERTEFAADKKEGARWSTTCVLVKASATMLELVATDTKRLSHGRVMGEFPVGECKVPLKAVALVLKNGGADGAEVAVTLGKNAASFRTDKWFVHTRLVEGRFPPYEQIIPKKLDHTAEVRASEFAGAVREAAVASDDQAKRVEFNFAGEECVLTARNSEGCAGESQCPVPGFDGDVKLAMDPQYVLDGLKVLDKNAVVRVRMTDESKPVLFEYGDDWTYLIMPLGQRD